MWPESAFNRIRAGWCRRTAGIWFPLISSCTSTLRRSATGDLRGHFDLVLGHDIPVGMKLNRRASGARQCGTHAHHLDGGRRVIPYLEHCKESIPGGNEHDGADDGRAEQRAARPGFVLPLRAVDAKVFESCRHRLTPPSATPESCAAPPGGPAAVRPTGR